MVNGSSTADVTSPHNDAMQAIWNIWKFAAHPSATTDGIRRFLLTTALLLALVGRGANSASGSNNDFGGPIEIDNGRHLYLKCRGKGSPTVILESGYHNSSGPATIVVDLGQLSCRTKSVYLRCNRYTDGFSEHFGHCICRRMKDPVARGVVVPLGLWGSGALGLWGGGERGSPRRPWRAKGRAPDSTRSGTDTRA